MSDNTPNQKKLTPNIEPLKLWLNTQETAKYIGVSISSIERFKKECGLPFSKVAMTTRFNRNSIDEWLLAHERRNEVM